MKKQGNEIIFTVPLIKTSKSNKPFYHVSLKPFRQTKLCVVHTLNYYIMKTKGLRKSQNLLVSFKTGKMVSTSTIVRWSHKGMSEAGIDINKFKAHSIRSAASSAAFRAGVSLKDILQTANWSSAQRFHTFYNRHIGENTSTRYKYKMFFLMQFSVWDV